MAEGQAQSLLFSRYEKPLPRKPPMTRSLRGDIGEQGEEILEQELHTEPMSSHSSAWQGEYTLFLRVLITTTICSVLLAEDRRGWVLSLSPSLNGIVSSNRASVQIFVQLLSNVLALCQVTVLCALINRATRLTFSRGKASMNDLQFWANLCTPSMSWRMPLTYLLPLLSFIGLTLIPSALWAGALSPISISTTYTSLVSIPSYENSSLIKEYPSEFDSTTMVSQVRNSKGVFSYRVGITMEGALLATASSATTVDGSPTKHGKLDYSGFTYIGRSYGVGAPAGLTDTAILDDTFTTSYSYQEAGYNAKVQCIYNTSTEFALHSDGGIIWEAKGLLPNSNGFAEASTYFGYTNISIVAIGVAAIQVNGTQYMGIAAGPNYAFLNATQCSIDYIPTLFNVTVNVESKNITVIPVSTSEDINPAGNITHTTTRQLELISNDQTNLYQSLLGNSLMASISDYNISQANSSAPLTEATSSLAGLTNSITAMLDDILVGYASAQLMVGNQSIAAEAVVTITALKVGQSIYISAIFVLNLVILAIMLEEMIRTTFWKGLERWDYMDLRAVIVSGLKGGKYMEEAFGDGPRDMEKTMQVGVEDISGKSWLRLDKRTGALVLDDRKRAYIEGDDFMRNVI